MRRGEACALRWSDVDWSASALTVNESLVVAKGGAAIKSPKTRASIRRLAIDSITLDSLSSLRTEQSQLAAFSGTSLDAEAFVFSVESGGSLPPHPDSMTHSFIRVRRIAGVSTDIHLHSLRHFQATVLDPVISERQKQARLGWSTVRMARHYTDVIEHEDRRAAQHLSRILDGAVAPDGPGPLAR
jgi:integrase